MGIPREPAAGGASRLASLFSATCGAAALGLTVAGCFGLARAAESLFGVTVPGLPVRLAAVLVGLPVALLAEAATFRLFRAHRKAGPDRMVPAVKVKEAPPPELRFTPRNRVSRALGLEQEELPWTE